MTGNLTGMAVFVVVLATAPAGFAADPLAELQSCRSLGDTERLACFDRVLARQDNAQTKSTPDFGAERLVQSAEEAKPQSMQSRVAKVSFNAFKHFSVTLDNGQVWRQLDSDTSEARLGGGDTVKITRGFLDSYSLSVEGAWGSYKVKRIK